MTFWRDTGGCVRCQIPVYEVIAVYETGPLAGTPRTLGAAREIHTQLRFLLSNGAEAAVDCCVDCAGQIGPADYAPIWDAVIDHMVRCVRHHRAAFSSVEAAVRQAIAPLVAVWPVARLGAQRELRELGRHIVDRRVGGRSL